MKQSYDQDTMPDWARRILAFYDPTVANSSRLDLIARMNTDHLANICSIAQGLLASGHFTEIRSERIDDEEAGEEVPSAKVWDAGDDWKEHPEPRRFPSFVADEALAVYKDILFRFTPDAEEIAQMHASLSDDPSQG